jgi:hypothetical protein
MGMSDPNQGPRGPGGACLPEHVPPVTFVALPPTQGPFGALRHQNWQLLGELAGSCEVSTGTSVLDVYVTIGEYHPAVQAAALVSGNADGTHTQPT